MSDRPLIDCPSCGATMTRDWYAYGHTCQQKRDELDAQSCNSPPLLSYP